MTINVPTLGLVEVPALGEILRALGYRVISGSTFPESASAVKIAIDTEASSATPESPAMIFPIVVADVHRPGIKAWAQKHSRTAPVLILRGGGDDYIIAAEARSLQLPATVGAIITAAGQPIGDDPRLELVIAADGSVVSAAPPVPVAAPTPIPSAEPAVEVAPSSEVSVALPAPVAEPLAAPVPPALPGAPVRAPWDTRPSEPAEPAAVQTPTAPALPELPAEVEPAAVVEPPAFERPEQLLFPDPEIVDEPAEAYVEPVVEAPAQRVLPPVALSTAPFFENSTRPTLAERPQWRNRKPAFGPGAVTPVIVAPVALPVATVAPPAAAPAPVAPEPVAFELPAAPAVAVAPAPAVAPNAAPSWPEPAALAAPAPVVVAAPEVAPAPVAQPPAPTVELTAPIPVPVAAAPISVQVAVEPVDDSPSWAAFIAPPDEESGVPVLPSAVVSDDGLPSWANAPAVTPVEAVIPAPVIAEPVAAPIVIAEPEPVAFAFEPAAAAADVFAVPEELPWSGAPVITTLNANAAPVVFCWAYKGGVNKTSLSLQLAHRASEFGMRVWLIDMNRGQGGIRTVLRIPENAPIRSAFDAARIGDPERAFVRPDEYTQYRPTGLQVLKFGLALAPPRSEADPESTPYGAYQQIINWARNNGDLVVVDTQSVEAVDQSGLISQVMVPTMINGGFGLGITEFAKESVENLKAAYADYRKVGLTNERQLMVVTRADNFLPVDAQGVDLTFSKYADFAGTTAQSRRIKEQFDKGVVVSDDPGVTPLLDTVLLRVTADERFSSMPMPGLDKPKRKGLFGGGRK